MGEIHLLTLEYHTASTGPDEKTKSPEQGGLSGSVLPQEGQDLAPSNRQVRDIESPRTFVGHNHVAEFEDALLHRDALRCWKWVSIQVMRNVRARRIRLKAMATSKLPRRVSSTVAVVSTRV